MDMKAFSLEGKVALVTGASYGIGFAIASGMAAAGATIVFNDINEDLVKKGLAAYEAAASRRTAMCATLPTRRKSTSWSRRSRLKWASSTFS